MFCCTGKLIPKESELEKYPWMKNFMSGYSDYKGIEHDLDIGDYKFSFKTSYELPFVFFEKTDKNAIMHGWNIREKTDSTRSYIKKMSPYPAANGCEEVRLSLNKKKERVIFHAKYNETCW